MSYKFIILAVGALAVFSCAKTEPESPVCSVEPTDNYIYIPLTSEESEDTKAYYHEESDYWTYLWEDEDFFHYFYFSRGVLQGDRFTQVKKTPTSTYLAYEASDLEVGNTIYSYFVQESLLEEADTNTNPENVKMVIPTLQVSNLDPETFTTQIDPSFDLGDFQLDKYQESGTALKFDVPSRTLSFKINDFNPEFTYSCKLEEDEGGFSDFTYDQNGNASVVITFDEVSVGDYDSTTEIRIYNKNYNKNYVTVSVLAERSALSAKFSYSVEKGARSTKMGSITTYGEDKPYPLRDAMPCASRGKIVTSSLLQYPEDIANSMTMYMLGSAAEFRIYSSTGRYAGEQIEKCIWTATNRPCAGEFYYDITSENLTISGYDKDTITSDVSACNYHVPSVKGGEDSVYLIIAPGTYNAQFKVITKDADGVEWQYSYNLNNKQFTRAMRKPFAVNLESSSATRVQYFEEGGSNEQGGGDDEDEA